MGEYIQPREGLSSKQKRKKMAMYEEKLLEKNKKTQIINIRKLLDEFKYNLALKSIKEYISKYGYDCYVIDVYGKYYLGLDRYEDAKTYFLANIESDAENKYYSMYEMAKIKKCEREYEEASKYLIQILNSDHPEKQHAMLELAKIYTVDEKYEEAEKILNELLEKDLIEKKYVYETLIQLNVNFYNLKKAEKLIEENEDLLKTSRIKLFKGQIEQKKGNNNKAKEYFQDIIDNENECRIKALYELSIIEMDAENYNGALILLDRILEKRNFSYNDALESKIDCFIKTNRVEEAEILIEELININKKSKDLANFYKGLIYFHDNNYIKALEYFNNISKKNRRSYRDAMYKKICIYIKLEKYDIAEKLFIELKEIDYSKKYLNKYIILDTFFNMKKNIQTTIPDGYIAPLIYDYNKEAVLEHIEKHKKEDNQKINHTIFRDDIDCNEIFDFALNNIGPDNYLSNNFCDTYLLEYINVGKNKEKQLDHIKVVTLPNTKKIVTIYPFDACSICKKEKQKQKSRIDKFKSKYGIS